MLQIVNLFVLELGPVALSFMTNLAGIGEIATKNKECSFC